MSDYPYRVNFEGLDDQRAQPITDLVREFTGDVVTREGDCIGVWRLAEDWRGDDEMGSGDFSFIPGGAEEPLFVQGIGLLDSRIDFGLSLSRFCSQICEWYEAENGPIG